MSGLRSLTRGSHITDCPGNKFVLSRVGILRTIMRVYHPSFSTWDTDKIDNPLTENSFSLLVCEVNHFLGAKARVFCHMSWVILNPVICEFVGLYWGAYKARATTQGPGNDEVAEVSRVKRRVASAHLWKSSGRSYAAAERSPT